MNLEEKRQDIVDDWACWSRETQTKIFEKLLKEKISMIKDRIILFTNQNDLIKNYYLYVGQIAGIEAIIDMIEEMRKKGGENER